MTSGKPETTCGDHGGTNSRGEPCGRAEGWGTDFDTGKCRIHRGTSPDGESHKNNGFAEKHSLFADRGKLYERLDEQKQALVDEIEHDLIERYREYHNRDPDRGDREDIYEVAIGYAQRRNAREYQAEQADESGNPILELREKDGHEFRVPSSVEEVIMDSRREDRLLRKHKGLEKDPETQKADAMERSIAEIMSVSD